MSPIHAWACFKRRTITRTASHSRLLSLGSCISAAVTVLSRRTTLPSSIFSCRALVSSIRLIASQVSARIALIVLCSTDFFGLHARAAIKLMQRVRQTGSTAPAKIGGYRRPLLEKHADDLRTL